MIYFYTRFLFHKSNLLLLIIVWVMYIVFTSCVFEVKVIGTDINLNNQILNNLKQYQLDFMTLYNSQYDYDKVIKKDFNKIDDIVVYKKGVVVYIEYTSKELKRTIQKSTGPLIALKDGIISSIDVRSGYVLVKKNQYVHKGDILVDTIIISTSDELMNVKAIGNIYAYTWYDIEVEGEYNDKGEAFFDLCLKSRNLLENKISKGSKIQEERVLHFNENGSKISMRVHYVVLENIVEGD